MVVDEVVAGSLRAGSKVVLALSAGQPSACAFGSAPAVGESPYVRVEGVAEHDGGGPARLVGGYCSTSISDAPLGPPWWVTMSSAEPGGGGGPAW